MNKQNYDALVRRIYLSFIVTFPIAIIVTPTHPQSQIFLTNVAIALYSFCLIALGLWMTLAYDLFGWREKLPPASAKYRLRIESSNVESKYILESQKSQETVIGEAPHSTPNAFGVGRGRVKEFIGKWKPRFPTGALRGSLVSKN